MVGGISASLITGLINSLNETRQSRNTSGERLASGKRINRAQDDAAGLAIAEALKADSKVNRQAARNAGDGISAARIAEGAFDQITEAKIRQQELAIQSRNGTLSDTDRAALDAEFQALNQEIDRIKGTTEFNGQSLLEGDSISIQAGNGSGPENQISIDGLNFDTNTGGNILTAEAAGNAVDAISADIQNIASVRGELGASVARLEVSADLAENRAIENEAAKSRIEDANIAQEAANEVATSIREQGTVAILAQANLNSQVVLNLLQ